MQGKIVKGIAGFYYVHTGLGLVECKAKGIFRKDKIKPLVGDNVEIELVDEAEKEGNIVRIMPRSNALIRPASANIDQALVIFAIIRPSPNYNLLDRFLITMEKQGLPSVICFNKKDIAGEKELEELKDAYGKCGYRVLFVSGTAKEGMEELRKCLRGKTTVVAGPSGVGKSTIINTLCPEANMETGEISQKIGRGKHTTRHAQLFALSEDTFIMDTPGFTALSLAEMDKEELKECYPEFADYEKECRFGGCSHISEPECGVKSALARGAVSRVRYENYTALYEELKSRRRY
ncbi:ribosome small subunit-dependent GTPase A [Parablautia intestinalis]|jgi:ribosome biogenesis GTPase|uniref:Small ribosomal subunit biogenesis GTPase RsgA n=1 Tax=Parablautia intestinalis TaxID=2320100 RepID=A0A3A9AUV7_9FIRM|nr:ribosome small subunit-dependent GTPase A [Parablautia intestinalis]MCI8613925.1 ribosome small subunit-dependent GTPase A [Lachnospiraceae bacterium]MDE7048432.1 ribosome small subunit-dependent GTPase A [Lachnospiraceae bacterium]RKI90145.1 ribosome small subunit-dependent GTPase A [Parablautia intestinalis]